MQVFISRFWGFRPETSPLITFGQAVYRDKLLAEARSGDRIVFVATKGAPTLEEERGRLLGMAEIGTRAVNTLDVLKPETIPADNWIGDKLKFPVAIPMLRAWRFAEKTFLLDVLEEQLGYHATVAAVLLSEHDAARILALPCEEVVLPDLEILNREREVSDRKSLMPSRGPVTTAGERSFTVPDRDYGYVYAFRFGKRNAWKIGNSYAPDKRKEHFNCNIPFDVIGERWEFYGKQKLSSPAQAHEIEQEAIKELAERAKSIGGEMFECDEKTFSEVWGRVVVGFLTSA